MIEISWPPVKGHPASWELFNHFTAFEMDCSSSGLRVHLCISECKQRMHMPLWDHWVLQEFTGPHPPDTQSWITHTRNSLRQLCANCVLLPKPVALKGNWNYSLHIRQGMGYRFSLGSCHTSLLSLNIKWCLRRAGVGYKAYSLNWHFRDRISHHVCTIPCVSSPGRYIVCI